MVGVCPHAPTSSETWRPPKADWRAFLENLKVRVLTGSNLKLMVIDGGTGLWAAIL